MKERIGEVVLSDGPIVRRKEFFAGKVPKEELPKGHVIYTSQGWSGEETIVETEGVKPVVIISVISEKETTGQEPSNST